jgi:hypothetical protein
MNAKHEKMGRLQYLIMRWIAQWCPWYIRLVAGKHADEVFRRIKDAEDDYRER